MQTTKDYKSIDNFQAVYFPKTRRLKLIVWLVLMAIVIMAAIFTSIALTQTEPVQPTPQIQTAMVKPTAPVWTAAEIEEMHRELRK